MMHPHPMNAADLDEFEQRFADDVDARPALAAGATKLIQEAADPVHQADLARATSCSPAEYQALETATRRQILEHLDAWQAEDRRIEGIFADLKRRRITTVVR
jgi:hypothetical protein